MPTACSSCAPVAQWLEQQTHNLLVRGSNPCGGTNEIIRQNVVCGPLHFCWADGFHDYCAKEQQMITKRDVLIGTFAVCMTITGMTLAQSRKLMTSSVFDWNVVEVKATKTGARRDFFDSPTATLDRLECHVTTLNPAYATLERHRPRTS